MQRIVEQRDASPDELEVREVCTSIYAFRRELFGPALRQLSPDNVQGEYYLTDVIGMLAGMGHRVACVEAPAGETQGVNDRWQLALAERELRSRTNRSWLLNGVTMLDPRQTFVDVTVAARTRRHAVPGHHAAGRHGGRQRLRARPVGASRRLQGGRRGCACSTAWRSRRRSPRARRSGRSPISRRCRASNRTRNPEPSYTGRGSDDAPSPCRPTLGGTHDASDRRHAGSGA